MKRTFKQVIRFSPPWLFYKISTARGEVKKFAANMGPFGVPPKICEWNFLESTVIPAIAVFGGKKETPAGDSRLNDTPHG